MFCFSSCGAWPVAAVRPDGYSGLRASIQPLEDSHGIPNGFRLKLDGSVDLKFFVPPTLRRTDLGKEMTLHLEGDTFAFHRNEISSAWKDCLGLVSKEILQGTPKEAAKKRREATAHALAEHPVADEERQIGRNWTLPCRRTIQNPEAQRTGRLAG